MKNKEAQVSGTPAAVVVLVIATFTLIYLVLIPSEDREELLGEKNLSSPDESVKTSELLLLDETPGTYSPAEQ